MGQAICSSESRMMTSQAKCGEGGSWTRSERTRRPRRRDSRPAQPSISPRRVRDLRMPEDDDEVVALDGDSSRGPDSARGLGRVGDTPGRWGTAGDEGVGEGEREGLADRDAVVARWRTPCGDGGRGGRGGCRGRGGLRRGPRRRPRGPSGVSLPCRNCGQTKELSSKYCAALQNSTIYPRKKNGCA
ncbi:hypothetical protein ONE63_004026 [Megalurothrips usitatus]|uniref:Uncharacterized protein n=1 Tax=Megalurothrips usitatus TaxID=439358 RepID=A0AAV7XAV8_9NEOP|nr:hypothetical protein ONE63_004026 [Megalurothrips usitatus]